MRSSSSFSSGFLAAAVLASRTAPVSAQSPLPPPQFTALLTRQFTGLNQNQTEGPFGTRTHIEASGGDLLDATTGELIGNVLSFSANGVTTASGLSFPSGAMPLTWSADGHFASVFIDGVGNGNVHFSYAHVETDSPTYS